ncbi:hypothetical protein Q4S45_18790 [Massilia sp. R2A-15]|uniref:hypothetical protein n=1 Tax=Massilia sp. R2A-15 TaxID=3064278 RepID=UPI0027362D62|nr:hypothetical protein [Massilia sp. R2A-15]WLI88745.1 hypothetical protein Q4S45_18790 [Massilia sp. R2A-15]
MLGAALLLFLATANALAAEPARRLCLRGPVAEPVVFHGALNYDKAGSGAGAMMYPAPGLVGMLAAVATHAAISGGMRESEKQKMRDEADKVLLPYRPALANYGHQELMLASLAEMKTAGDKHLLPAAAPCAEGEVVADGVPSFFMTQDQRALILENAISIQGAGARPYQKIIRVISPAQDEGAGVAAWFNDRENLLRKVSARMVAQSLDIALADAQAAGEPSDPFKTVRYNEGGAERMERAQVISDQCGQLVLRTLRGNLIAVPSKAPQAPAAGCPAAAL